MSGKGADRERTDGGADPDSRSSYDDFSAWFAEREKDLADSDDDRADFEGADQEPVPGPPSEGAEDERTATEDRPAGVEGDSAGDDPDEPRSDSGGLPADGADGVDAEPSVSWIREPLAEQDPEAAPAEAAALPVDRLAAGGSPAGGAAAGGPGTSSLLDGFGSGQRRPGPGVRLTRGQLIAMAVGVAVTLAGVGWAVASPSTAKPSPSPSATADPKRAAAAAAAIDELADQVKEAAGVAAEFEAPLAALQGASDEPARVAAETARQAYAQAVAAVVVPAKPARTADPAALKAVEKSTAAAQNALVAAGTAFHTAITAFIGTMPGYAVQAVAANSDGSADLRNAATSAAIKMASSDPFTPPWFAPWDAWRDALAALIADAGTSSDSREWSGGGGTSDGADTPAAPPATTAPVDPPPATEAPPDTETTPPSPPATP